MENDDNELVAAWKDGYETACRGDSPDPPDALSMTEGDKRLIEAKAWAEERYKFWLEERSSDVVMLHRNIYKEFIDQLNKTHPGRVVEGIVGSASEYRTRDGKNVALVEIPPYSAKSGTSVKVILSKEED